MTHEILMQQFHFALSKMRLELMNHLEQIDVLDEDKLHSTLNQFNQRLVVAQYDFLQFLSQVTGKAGATNSEFKLQTVAASKIPELATTILAGGGAAVLINLITFTGSSWIFFTTTTSAATVLGGLAGVSAGVATAGIGVAVGLGAGILLNQSMKSWRRRQINNKIMTKYDSDVVSQLKTWADENISNALRS